MKLFIKYNSLLSLEFSPVLSQLQHQFYEEYYILIQGCKVRNTMNKKLDVLKQKVVKIQYNSLTDPFLWCMSIAMHFKTSITTLPTCICIFLRTTGLLSSKIHIIRFKPVLSGFYPVLSMSRIKPLLSG